uniref:Uncharacterized protein n=1 Tax=Oryzias sinensis TaxID=183150 RepID=A0A8C7YSI8_9TELE
KCKIVLQLELHSLRVTYSVHLHACAKVNPLLACTPSPCRGNAHLGRHSTTEHTYKQLFTFV